MGDDLKPNRLECEARSHHVRSIGHQNNLLYAFGFEQVSRILGILGGRLGAIFTTNGRTWHAFFDELTHNPLRITRTTDKNLWCSFFLPESRSNINAIAHEAPPTA